MAKKSIKTFDKMFREGRPVTWVTAYDFPFAQAAEAAGVDMILVGDSLAMTHLGYGSTNPVTMDQMITFTAAARRGAPDTFLIGDMPQGSYEVSDEQAVRNATRFYKEAGVDAVKLEGGARVASQVEHLVDANFTVFGHLGLTPQSAAAFGGYRVQGKDLESFDALCEDAIVLEEAGVFAILLEAVPSIVSQQIQKQVPSVPIYGVGAGHGIAGQLLIMHDLVGFYRPFRPYFAKCYIPEALPWLNDDIHYGNPPPTHDIKEYGRAHPGMDGFYALAVHAIKCYCKEVRGRVFPQEEYCYPIKIEEIEKLRESVFWTD